MSNAVSPLFSPLLACRPFATSTFARPFARRTFSKKTVQNKKTTADEPLDIATTLITSSICASCRLWMKLPILGPRSVSVNGMEKFTTLIQTKPPNQPLITVSNHTATIDDPMIWSLLPFWIWRRPRQFARWVLGAKELCFKNLLVGYFFGKGQTIPIERGMGLNQEGMDIALEKLKLGSWIQIFPEGKVNQQHSMIRFKWGIAKLIMESETTPWVVPIYQRGMNQVIPLGKPFPPRPGKDLLFSFGDAVDFGPILKQLRRHNLDLVTMRMKLTFIISDMMHAWEWKSREWWQEELARKSGVQEPLPRYLCPVPDYGNVDTPGNAPAS
jgi:monolysocardiolipin acyltransferase